VSIFNRKGYRAVQAKDPNTGKVFTAPLRVNGTVARIFESKNKQLEKRRKAEFRKFKEQMRVAKKAIPLDQRAKVNWSEVQNV
jgi:hypothetical protein